ncbi:hypothetical protein [Butyrivibrio sp. VCB2001]|uniref:hypothetical protein n=1 Tax=Butyrivibrio sp. VCB2001 TaxID=1280667 RepID=UPI00041425F3|nr:hypothetical protein [Butyrivibrio sp. VCB2001]
MKNYLMLKDFSIFSQKYVFVDVNELLYTRIFREAGVRIKETWEYAKEGSGLMLIICRILKKDREKFEKAVVQIRNGAILMGYRDYDDACRMLQDIEKR